MSHRTFYVFNVYVPSFSIVKGEKVKRQGHEKGQSRDKYVECDIADKVLDWDLGRLGTTPNLVPLWPEANYYTSAKDKKVRSFSNIKQHDLTT